MGHTDVESDDTVIGLDIEPHVQEPTMRMRICEHVQHSKVGQVNPRRPASQTIGVAGGGYAILVQALVGCAAQSLLERAPVEP